MHWQSLLCRRHLGQGANERDHVPDGLVVMRLSPCGHRAQFHTMLDGPELLGGLLTVEGFSGAFKSFSAASQAVTSTSRNGWLDWHLKTGAGEWLLADDWRKEQA